MASSSHRSRTRSLARSSPCSATPSGHGEWANQDGSGFRKSGRGTSSPSGPSAPMKRRASGPLPDSVENAARRGGKVARERVEGPDAPFGDLDETGLAKLSH